MIQTLILCTGHCIHYCIFFTEIRKVCCSKRRIRNRPIF